MRHITSQIIILSVLASCNPKMDESDAVMLGKYLSNLESSIPRLDKRMNMACIMIEQSFDELDIKTHPILEDSKKILTNARTFQEYMNAWKSSIILKGDGLVKPYFYDNWNLFLKPMKYKPENDNWPDISVSGRKSMIMALIELTNLEIIYLTKQYHKLAILESNVMELPSETLFASYTSDHDPNAIYLTSFGYYPIDSLQINGKWYFGEEFVEMPRKEWDKLVKTDLDINLSLKLYWGDTTFQFSSKKLD